MQTIAHRHIYLQVSNTIVFTLTNANTFKHIQTLHIALGSTFVVTVMYKIKLTGQWKMLLTVETLTCTHSVHSFLFSYSQNSGDSNFFARKFEAIVNQHIINEIDAYLLRSLPGNKLPGWTAIWENAFHDEDDVTQPSSARYTVYNSFMRTRTETGTN